MDKFLIDNLEGYLSGQLGDADREEYEARLNRSPKDLEAVRRMGGISGLFGTLDEPQDATLGPAPGFQRRVFRTIEENTPPSIWDWFLQPVVVRRTALAAAAWLVLLVSGAISQTVAQPTSEIARAVLAERPESADYCNVRLGCDIDVNRSSMLAAVIVTGSRGR